MLSDFSISLVFIATSATDGWLTLGVVPLSVGKDDGGLVVGIGLSGFGVSFVAAEVGSFGGTELFCMDVLVGLAVIFGAIVGEASFGGL